MKASELPDTVLHFAALDAYRGIFTYGMRPARRIVEDAGFSEDEVLALTTEPRSDFTYLPANDKSDAVRLAHNKPLMNGSSAVLEKCLAKGNKTLGEFCQMLAKRIFFWGDVNDSTGYQANMAAAGPYDRISFRTSTLLRLAEEQGVTVEVSRYNSGSTPFDVVPRGDGTWTSIAEAQKGHVKEFVMVGTLHDVSKAATAVTRIEAGQPDKVVWRGGAWDSPA